MGFASAKGVWVILAGCSDYELQDPAGEKIVGGDDTAVLDSGSTPFDTAAPPPDTAPPTDTGEPPTDVSPPENEDACYEPEDGYEKNAAARIVTDDGKSSFTVTFLSSDTSYSNALWVDSPTSRLVARNWADPVGSSLSLGPYAKGTEVIFAIQVQDTGLRWQSGPGSRNSDGVIHGAVTYEGNCSWLVGFEDLEGGGDLDFNDIVMRVEGVLRQER